MKKKKSHKIEKFLFVVLQALFLAGLFVIVLFYILSARVYFSKDGVKDSDHKIASIGELRTNYYESDVYKQNLILTLRDISKYVVIKDLLETDGLYDEKKVVNIGDFAYRNRNENFGGPDVYFYLDDLIMWGQAGIKHSYYTFNSFDDMDEYFKSDGKISLSQFLAEGKDFDIYDDETEAELDEAKNVNNHGEGKATDESTKVPTLDMVKNAYKSIEGKNLDQYAKSAEEYSLLISVLEETTSALYENYMLYVTYTNYFNSDNSNIKYYVSKGTGAGKVVYSNLTNFRIIGDDTLADTFREMGEFIYCEPGKLDYLTNTPLDYETVKNSICDYDYSFYDDAVVWLGLDVEYPVKDTFYENCYSFAHSISILPWIISLSAVALIGFVAILIYLTGFEIKSFDNKEEDITDKLGDFDKLPIEVEILFFGLIGTIIYISARIVLDRLTLWSVNAYADYLGPTTTFVFLSAFFVLMLYYSMVRRICSKNFWDRSFIAWLVKVSFKNNHFVKRLFWKIYDDSNTAVRTWTLYIFFLIFNTFWACMLFFSRYHVLSFILLFLFDICTGFYLFNKNTEQKKIVDGIRKINEGDYDYSIDTTKMHGENKTFAEAVNDIGMGLRKAVETSTKDEKLKADLITNVSHDIKTPLTSIINYVDLIKRENIDNDKVNNYVRILDEKSQRLKQLTMDLVEASKVTSGNVTLELNRINFTELLNQTLGEFEERFETRGLSLVKNLPKDPVVIMADPRRMFRIIENLFNNVFKYAMENTRVYLDLTTFEEDGHKTMNMSLKNISSSQLNFAASELTERFIRGDVARSTEGSGLGLSIAKSLTKLHGGIFDIYLDGDLFKVSITFDICE